MREREAAMDKPFNKQLAELLKQGLIREQPRTDQPRTPEQGAGQPVRAGEPPPEPARRVEEEEEEQREAAPTAQPAADLTALLELEQIPTMLLADQQAGGDVSVISQEASSALGIELLNGPEDGMIFPLDREDVIIGREPQGACTLMIASDPHVSRQHLQLSWREGSWWATDLQSANGTLLVSTGTRLGQQPVSLQAGQVLRLGKSTYIRLTPVPPASEGQAR